MREALHQNGIYMIYVIYPTVRIFKKGTRILRNDSLRQKKKKKRKNYHASPLLSVPVHYPQCLFPFSVRAMLSILSFGSLFTL